MIKVLYFARLREQLGIAGEELPPLDGPATVDGIVTLLRQRNRVWSDVFREDQTIMAAVNREMARPETRVQDGDEVAFFPPVTGG
jgi:molybdopterin synthase sulfur carrier subunit